MQGLRFRLQGQKLEESNGKNMEDGMETGMVQGCLDRGQVTTYIGKLQ